MNTTLRDEIWKRQYAIHPDEDYLSGLKRVADYVASAEEPQKQPLYSDSFYSIMAENKFIPGGRILAGAGTEHGNMLNCFVVDESPLSRGTTRGVLHLAKKLALITKVGGGCGVNLDYITPKSFWSGELGRVSITIKPDHPDYEKVKSGTYLNQVTGKYITKGYRRVQFLEYSDSIVATHVCADSVEGIWECASTMVLQMLNSNNVVIDLSLLRPEGQPVRGSGGTSSGPASFAVEIFDNFAHWASLGGAENAGPVATLRYLYAPTLRVIRQGGSRRGAGMATLSVNHLDIRDFITAKDLDREAKEGDISTFNISVLADDDFMEKAIHSPTPWTDSEQEELLQDIAQHAWETGEPGVIFVDTINKHNPLIASEGPIVTTNPCGEVPLYPGEPCDLGAVNLAAFVDDKTGVFSYDDLKYVVDLAVRFLDNVLTLEKAPLQEIENAINDKRRIGLGVMGLADTLIKMGYRYDSAEGRALAGNLVRTMTEQALRSSKQLADERGVPPALAKVNLNRRNIALMTVAPTGTTSMLAGVSSGIEPVFSGVMYRRIGTEYKTIIHPLLDELLKAKYGDNIASGWHSEILYQIQQHHGSVQPLIDSGLLPNTDKFKAFRVAHDIHYPAHVLMQATVQDAIDYTCSDVQPSRKIQTFAGNSLSKTINLPKSANVGDVLDAYSLAWRKGCKGITVYRDGSRELQVLSTSAPTDTKKEDVPNMSEMVEPEDPLIDAVLENKNSEVISGYIHRPSVVLGHSYKFEVQGRKTYVQVFVNDDGEIVEVWTPSSKGASSSEKTTHEIIGRLASLALKHGASAQALAQTFSGHMDDTGGISRGIGYVGSKWELVAHAIGHTQGSFKVLPEQVQAPLDATTCDDCGGQLVRESGCITCHTCGASRCG